MGKQNKINITVRGYELLWVYYESQLYATKKVVSIHDIYGFLMTVLRNIISHVLFLRLALQRYSLNLNIDKL